MKIDIRSVTHQLDSKNKESYIEILKGDTLPILILEDGVARTDWYKDTIEVPDDTDAIYLGISQGNGDYIAQDISEPNGEWLAKIQDVQSSYAILYLSERYKKEVLSHTNQKIDLNLACAKTQKNFKVVTPHLPFFFQEENKETTLLPLKMLAYGAGPLGPGYGQGPIGG